MRHRRAIPGFHIEKFSLIALPLADQVGDIAIGFVNRLTFRRRMVLLLLPVRPRTVSALPIFKLRLSLWATVARLGCCSFSGQRIGVSFKEYLIIRE